MQWPAIPVETHRAIADRNHDHHFARRLLKKLISVRKYPLSGLLLSIGIAVILNGCSAHRPPNPTTPLVDRGYLDLKAGWRIRVVTPINRSGSFQLETTQTEQSGPGVTLNSGNDFLGYEVAYYAVTARQSDGVAVSFVRAERIIGGAVSQQASPSLRPTRELSTHKASLPHKAEPSGSQRSHPCRFKRCRP